MSTLDELENRWQPTSQAVLHTMQEWRQQHPKATFQEMETALDEQLARLRAQMLQDLALTSPSAELPRMREAEHPTCKVWDSARSSRNSDAYPPDRARSAHRTVPQLCHLSAVRGGSFSPWMRNWPSCQDH